jgi:competence ComEA-like helix-hairpin-helix protein
MTFMEREPSPSFMLPGHTQPLLAFAVLLGLAGVAVWMAWMAGQRRGAVDHDAPPEMSTRFTVDLNTAAAAELAALPGVGPTTAARIVDRRRDHGPFRSAEELLDIPGIGAHTLDRLRPHLRPLRGAATGEGP